MQKNLTMGEKIGDLLSSKGINAQKLSDDTGIPKATISEIISNKEKNFGYKTIVLQSGEDEIFSRDIICKIIKDINKDGTTILLVEQNAGKSLAISDRAYVLETGSIVLSGTGAELAASDKVKEAYLGG